MADMTTMDMTTKNNTEGIEAEGITIEGMATKNKAENGKGRCFAKREGRCLILDRIGCGGCTFYQTKEELVQGREKALLHIADLPKQEREYIRLKYVLRR